MFDDWISREGLNHHPNSHLRSVELDPNRGETWWLTFRAPLAPPWPNEKWQQLAVSKLGGGFKFQIFFIFIPTLGKWSHLTNMIYYFFKWVESTNQKNPFLILWLKNPNQKRWNVLEIFVPLGFLDHCWAGGFWGRSVFCCAGKSYLPKDKVFKKFLEKEGPGFFIVSKIDSGAMVFPTKKTHVFWTCFSLFRFPSWPCCFRCHVLYILYLAKKPCERNLCNRCHEKMSWKTWKHGQCWPR